MIDLHLDITLRRNRAQPGFFVLKSAAGQVVFTGFCLGKADNLRAASEDNSLRLSTMPFGDTPTGIYKPTTVVMFDKPHQRMGLGWIPIQGESGKALIAHQSKNSDGTPKRSRSGLGIHAGRGDGRLVPTFGCIRVQDKDFARLAAHIEGHQVQVTIDEEDV